MTIFDPLTFPAIVIAVFSGRRLRVSPGRCFVLQCGHVNVCSDNTITVSSDSRTHFCSTSSFPPHWLQINGISIIHLLSLLSESEYIKYYLKKTIWRKVLDIVICPVSRSQLMAYGPNLHAIILANIHKLPQVNIFDRNMNIFIMSITNCDVFIFFDQFFRLNRCLIGCIKYREGMCYIGP